MQPSGRLSGSFDAAPECEFMRREVACARRHEIVIGATFLAPSGFDTWMRRTIQQFGQEVNLKHHSLPRAGHALQCI